MDDEPASPGPAERSGKIFAGDVLVEINGTHIDNMTLSEVQGLLRGEPKSSVTVSLERRQGLGDAPRMATLTLVRQRCIALAPTLCITSLCARIAKSFIATLCI